VNNMKPCPSTALSHAKPATDRPISPVTTLLKVMVPKTDRAQANNPQKESTQQNAAGQSYPGHLSPAPSYCGGNDCPAQPIHEFGSPPRIQGSLLAKPSGTASGTRSFTNSQTGG